MKRMMFFLMAVVISLGTMAISVFAFEGKISKPYIDKESGSKWRFGTLSSYIRWYTQKTTDEKGFVKWCEKGMYKRLVEACYPPKEAKLIYSTLNLTYVTPEQIKEIGKEAANWAVAQTIQMAKESDPAYYQQLINNKALNTFDWQNVDFSLVKEYKGYETNKKYKVDEYERLLNYAYLYGYLKVKREALQKIAELWGYSFEEFVEIAYKRSIFHRNRERFNKLFDIRGGRSVEAIEKGICGEFCDKKIGPPPLGTEAGINFKPVVKKEYKEQYKKISKEMRSLIDQLDVYWIAGKENDKKTKELDKKFQKKARERRKMLLEKREHRFSLGKIGYIQMKEKHLEFVPWEKDVYYREAGVYCSWWTFPTIWKNILIEDCGWLGKNLGLVMKFGTRPGTLRKGDQTWVRKYDEKSKKVIMFSRSYYGEAWFGIKVRFIEDEEIEKKTEEIRKRKKARHMEWQMLNEEAQIGGQEEKEELEKFQKQDLEIEKIEDSKINMLNGQDDHLAVTKVYPGSPADKLGIKQGDVILWFYGNIPSGSVETRATKKLRWGMEDLAEDQIKGKKEGSTTIFRDDDKKIRIPAEKMYVEYRSEEDIPPGSY